MVKCELFFDSTQKNASSQISKNDQLIECNFFHKNVLGFFKIPQH